jgi:hypothetical protein
MSKVREFFKKAGSGARKFFSKADSAIGSGLNKLGGVARQVGNIAQQALPLAALVAPEFAPAIALAGTASNLAGTGIKRAQQVQGSVRKGIADTKRVIQAPLPADNSNFNPAPMFA